MWTKGLFYGKSATLQISFLVLFILIGAIFSSLAILFIYYVCYGTTAGMTDHANFMRFTQFVSSIATFLLPALCLAYLCSYKPRKYLFIEKLPDGYILILVFISMFLLMPIDNLAALINKQMELPSFMEPIENWMHQEEDSAERITTSLVGNYGIWVLIANLIVIAMTAGITEEFLFRGALQRIFSQWTSNHHIVIWETAIIFSAFHLQFFGFLPRMLLGAYFGYLLYWSRNIWIPVFAHFVNNAFAIIGMSNEPMKNNEYINGDISTQHLLPYTIIAIIMSILFWICIRKIRKVSISRIKNLSAEE